MGITIAIADITGDKKSSAYFKNKNVEAIASTFYFYFLNFSPLRGSDHKSIFKATNIMSL